MPIEAWSSFRRSASQLRKANVTPPGLTNENLYEAISMKSTAPVKVRFPVVPACVRSLLWAGSASKHDPSGPNSKANKGRCLVGGDPYNNGRLRFTYWMKGIMEVLNCAHSPSNTNTHPSQKIGTFAGEVPSILSRR